MAAEVADATTPDVAVRAVAAGEPAGSGERTAAAPAGDPVAGGGVLLGGADGLDGPAGARIAAAVDRSRSPATMRAYQSDWARFSAWCTPRGYASLPATAVTVADYLTAAAEARDAAGDRVFAPATLTRWVAALNAVHAAAGHPAPGGLELVRVTLAGIRRMYAEAGERPVRRAAPLLLADLRTLLDTARAGARTWAEQVAERRDALVLLLGFAGAFRRAELVALTAADVRVHPEDGLHVRLGRSKTDQDGAGAVKALPYGRAHQTCPVCAYLRWRTVLDAFDGEGRVGVLRVLSTAAPFTAHVCSTAGELPDCDDGVALLRGVHKTGAISDRALSGQAINPLLARRAEQAGLDPTLLARLGGHSLRAGFVTQAVRGGASPAAIMRQTGHRTDAMVRLYTREAAPLTGNAVTDLGL